nr:immunoglobulin light chain junction region [Macaca mulatta]MOW02681.1 immunoglobulin light chain junction region [Macaca mulatta]
DYYCSSYAGSYTLIF